jgi:hypothetical protein
LVSRAKDEHNLKVFENKLLRRIFRPKRQKYQEVRELCIMRNFIGEISGSHGSKYEDNSFWGYSAM